MSSTTSNPQINQGDLFGAALRYCAVANWFESHPCAWRKHLSVNQAMEIFNRAEADLRAGGFLSPLKSKAGKYKANTAELHIRGGEFVPGEVEALMDQDMLVH